MKLSDYLVDFLAKEGIKHTFLVTGGAILHLADSTCKHADIRHIGVQHEEFGAASADAYSRVTGNMGLVMTTSGPGATNLLTSICNAYFDSIPMIAITGQVARFRLRPNIRLRQRGFQETDITAVYHSVTKYVKLVTDPEMIRYELEKAIYLAKEGRPGPVILDIPDDLQRLEINPEELQSFSPPTQQPLPYADKIQQLESLINEAKRPVVIIGAGVHCAKVEEEAIKFVKYFQLPVLLTWGATDLLTYSDELNMGGVGVCGPRSGNFAAQYSDLVIAIGTRLSQMITGGKQDMFAPNAKKAMVEIDPEEISKFGPDTFCIDLPILSDLNSFFQECQPLYSEAKEDAFLNWRQLIRQWREEYPICSESNYKSDNKLDPYVFVKEFSKHVAQENDIIVTDTGANICWVMQAFEVKAKQKIFSAWNHTPMGYALPASIGAALGSGKEVYCLIGDGGLMMCLQELATINRYNLPVKIFLFDNQGHATCKQTIEIWLQSRYVVVDESSGLSFPDYQKLAETFSIPYLCIEDNADLLNHIGEIPSRKGPYFCHLKIDEVKRIEPMLKFGAGLENLDPALPASEIERIAYESQALEANFIKP